MRTIQPFTVEINVITSKGWMPAFAGMTPSMRREIPGAVRHPGRPLRGYLIACGLIGEPVPPVMISGGPQKKNS
jgi:hypothetical protein